MMQVAMRIAATALLTCALAGPSVSAQEEEHLLAACKAGIAQLCSAEARGGGRIRACLEANKDKLAAECKVALQGAGQGQACNGTNEGACSLSSTGASACEPGATALWDGCYTPVSHPVLPGSAAGRTGIRRFRMVLWLSPSGADADVKTFVEGSPQPPGRSVLHLSNWNSDKFSALFAWQAFRLNWDFSRIEAVVVDEPLWRATGGTDLSNPCSTQAKDSRYAAIQTAFSQLVQASETVKAYSQNLKFWVNFSEPEMQWQMDETCPLHLNGAHIDVISLDKYFTDFSSVKPYYDWLLKNRAKPSQQIALIPGTVFRDGIDDPNVQASYLADFFEYANRMNQRCDAQSPQGGKGCLVWIVAGWPAATYTDASSGVIWRGELDPKSSAISNVWRAELAKPVR